MAHWCFFDCRVAALTLLLIKGIFLGPSAQQLIDYKTNIKVLILCLIF
jgi:hypothetical protein